MGPIRGMVISSLLLKINEHTTISRKGSSTARAAWGRVLGENERARTRGTILFSGKQYCRTHREQERELSFTEGNSSCTSHHKVISEKWLLRNTFGQKAFSQPRARTLDDVGMSLASAQQTQATSTQVLFVLKKRKRKYFFFSVFRATLPTTQR